MPFGIPLPFDPFPMRRARGLDVSEAQGAYVDFLKVREVGGFDYVTIKATEGKDYTDRQFDSNVKRAKAAGLLVRCYHFLSSKTPVAMQMAHYANVIRGVADLKPVIDFEAPEPSTWARLGLTGLDLTKRALEGARLLEQDFGPKQVMIYSYPDFLKHLPASAELVELASFDLWYAKYYDQKHEPKGDTWPDFPAMWKAPKDDTWIDAPLPWGVPQEWQWSGDGGLSAPGCTAVVDHDLYIGTIEELRATLLNVDPSGETPTGETVCFPVDTPNVKLRPHNPFFGDDDPEGGTEGT